MLVSTFRSSLFYIIILVLSVCAFYSPMLTGDAAIAPGGDTIQLTGALFCEISRQAKNGLFPLLDWTTFEPIHYNAHVTPLYPFYFWRFLDFCSPERAVYATNLVSVFHICLLTIGAFFLGRCTGLSRQSATCFSLLLALCVNTNNLAVFPTIIAPAAWLLFSLAGLVLIVFRERYLAGILILATSLSLMFAAGPGTNMINPLVLLSTALAGWGVAVAVWNHQWRKIVKSGLALAFAGATTLVVSIATTFNLLQHLGEVVRYTRTGAVIGGSGPASPTEILFEHAAWSDLAELLVPGPRHLGLGSFALGAVLITMASIGLFYIRRSVIAPAFALIACICFCVAFLFSKDLLLYWVYIPGLGHTRHISLLATSLSVACCWLAAFGLAELLADARARRNWFSRQG